jgi:membrane protease YdiL (CAAX protease family)
VTDVGAAAERWTPRAIWRAFVGAPDYPPSAADLRTVEIVGVRLPVRASVAIAVITFALLFDYSRTFLPPDIVAHGRDAVGLRGYAIDRLVLLGLVPLAIVLFGFRDRPSRYGLTLGDARAGIALLILGCVLMTPVVLAYVGLPGVRGYYAPSAAPLPEVVLTNAIDLPSVEFGLRGFLMLTLIRAIGPVGMLVAVMPFVFAHLGKPEVELFSTLGGGLVYGWVTWRTRSIVWGAAAHVYILSLLTLAAAPR